MNAEDDDAEAMGRLRDGDDLALNELMDRWQRRVTSYLLRATGREDVAIDLAEETFVRVYASRDRYRPSGRFSTWLFAIAANLARQHFRWQRRHPEVSIDAFEPGDGSQSLGERFVADADGPGERLEEDESARLVREAVTALPDELREAVILFEYEDFSHEQIARIAGCSPKAVEMRLYRARAVLREKLKGLFGRP